MTQLQCSAVHCEYNRNQLCCRPDIKVGGGRSAKTPHETCCDSFRERSAKATNEATYSQPDKALKVACSAALCEYNSDGCCVAKAIKIGGSQAFKSSETECHTFSCGPCTHCR